MQKEFASNDVEAEVKSFTNPQRVELIVRYENVENFVYGVQTEFEEIPEYVNLDANMPNQENNRNYIAKAYFGDNRKGYDVLLFTHNELIGDVIKHFDRYLKIVSVSDNELFVRKQE